MAQPCLDCLDIPKTTPQKFGQNGWKIKEKPKEIGLGLYLNPDSTKSLDSYGTSMCNMYKIDTFKTV